jgi:four helix bundle protein
MQDDRPIQFTHERLEAYKVAREFLALAHAITSRFPRGAAPLGDQLARAATSALLNTAEGAGRREGREKARFFDIARGSAAECAAIVDAIELRALAAPPRVADARGLLYRLVRLLAGLARSSALRGAGEG